VGKDAPKERRAEFVTEVEWCDRKMWARYLARASSGDDIEFALAMREKLDVPADVLDGRARFNIALFEARHRADRSPGPPNELQAAIEALPANLRVRPRFAAFGRDSPEQDEGHPIDFSMLGPMASAATCGHRSRGITRSM